MNYYRKIFIDRLVGTPLIFITNIIARLAGFLLRRNHSLKDIPQRVIVCKLVGIGSIVQSTTLLMNLKKQFPELKIAYLSSSGNQVLLENIPLVDEVITINDQSLFSLFISTMKAIWKCWRFKPDIFLDIEVYSNLTSILSCFSMARDRIGFYRKDQSMRLGIYTHMLYFNIKAPINQSNLQMGRQIGCVNTSSELFPIEVSVSVKKNAEKKLSENYQLIPGQYILINPNASDLRIERRWRAERFTEFINKISEVSDLKCVLIGSKDERSYVESIIKNVNPDIASNLINTAGELSIPELLCLIKNATFMLTNDTGPMHLAFALKTKTLSLFGPCNPIQYGNMTNGIAIYKEVYCSPCVHEFLIPPCYGDNQCMKMISVKEVLEAVDKIIRGATKTTVVPGVLYNKENSDVPLGLITRKQWVI